MTGLKLNCLPCVAQLPDCRQLTGKMGTRLPCQGPDWSRGKRKHRRMDEVALN